MELPAPQLHRAQLLFQQGRYDLADRELRGFLAEQPNSSFAHALLGLCLAETEKFDEAAQEIGNAIHLDPDEPFNHYANACLLHDRNRFVEAEQAILEATRLDPYDADYFGKLANVRFSLRRWDSALEAAESGLALDPQHALCLNFHAMSLVKLGRKGLANETLTTALRHDPENALTHANQGWTLLEARQPEKAMEHFREALRLDPELEWARRGIIEAMKARYFVYRYLLAYFLWMMKLQRRAQFGILAGGFLGYQFLLGLQRQYPAWSPFLMPLIILYVAFALSTWLASPLFNLLLRLNRFGKLALSREETWTSNGVGLCVLGSLGFLASYFLSEIPGTLFGAVACMMIVPPFIAIRHCAPGWPKYSIVAITVFVALCGLFGFAAIGIATNAKEFLEVMPRMSLAIMLPGVIVLKSYFYICIGSQLAANYLASVVPRR